MDSLFIIIVLCYILRNLGTFLLLCLMDKARFISLSFLSLSLLSICVPFVPLSFLSLSCSPICPVASTVLLLSYPLPPLSQSISVLLFSFFPSVLNSVSLISAWSPLLLAHQCAEYALYSGWDSCSPCDVSGSVREREMAGDLKRDSAHFSFFHVPVESMVLGHVDVRWLQDHQALLTQPVVLIFMGVIQQVSYRERRRGREEEKAEGRKRWIFWSSINPGPHLPTLCTAVL